MTEYLISDDVTESDIDSADEDTIILVAVTPRGRKLLAQGVEVRRVIELREATTEKKAKNDE